VGRVAAVVTDPGNFQKFAIDKIAAPAWIASKAVPAMPSDADPIADFPIPQIFAERVDHSGDFMPRRSRISDPRPCPFFRKHVAMTNSAGLNSNPNLLARRLDDFFINKFEWSLGLFDSNGFHNSSPLEISSIGDFRITLESILSHDYYSPSPGTETFTQREPTHSGLFPLSTLERE
jgi:hypothetical protein